MALVLYTSALLVGLDIIYFKYAQFLLNDFSETWPEVVLYNLFGVCCAVTSIHLLNLCEKIFDQTDVLPTYYSMLVLNQIFTGLVVANGVLDVERLCTAIPEIRVVQIPRVDPDTIVADWVGEELGDVIFALSGRQFVSDLLRDSRGVLLGVLLLVATLLVSLGSGSLGFLFSRNFFGRGS